MENQNNKYMYCEIVKDEKDIVGIIAYSLYKEDKMKFIKDHMVIKNGEEPTSTELKIFQNEKLKDIEKYRSKSSNMFTELFNDAISEERKEIASKLDKYNKDKKELNDRLKNIEQRDRICKVKSWSFWSGVRGVGVNFISSILFLGLSLIIILNFELSIDLLREIVEKIKKVTFIRQR